MRKFKKEADLLKMADKISQNIVIRMIVRGSSYDTTRLTTAPEKDIIGKIAYGALLALNESEINRSDPKAEKAIVSCAEYLVNQFIPECNGYDTMSIPLNNALEDWEKETVK